jgi:eukaryotic-like serine/threonine-protein kinase
MSLDSGARLGPYEILAAIGSGGMGVVYRARDTRLGRIVAIKLARPLTFDDLQARRLLREAQHASALNHPNICTLHEIGDADGQPFIVFEYVDGEPVSALIPKGGLPHQAVVAFGSQIAAALEHAHARGIVHRDLKPANVVVTADRRVKVLDFGLAQRLWHEGAAQAATVPLTQPAGFAGTIAYMAPEALRGAAADPRCDIWALGVMLHEMAAGAPPFRGRTEFELSSRILQEPAAELPASVPPALRAVVAKCLEKDPARRYQHAEEVRAALDACAAGSVHSTAAVRLPRLVRPRMLAGAAATAIALFLLNRFFIVPVLAITSVAVVPFASEGTAPDDEYLSDGVTEGVIDKLAQLPRSTLKVIAFNSVRGYKSRSIDTSAVGKELHVGAVVVGRLAQTGSGFSVTSELVNASDRSRMWGKTFTATIADLPTVQTEIAAQVSAALRVPVNPEQKDHLARRTTGNAEAYRLYLKGRYFWNKYTEDGWKRSIDLFKQAIDLDPTDAAAWAGLADSYYQLSSLVLLPAEAMPLARAAATRALAIDDGLAEAHASLGIIKEQYDWDPKAAAREFQKALELNPSYAPAHVWYGTHLFANTHFEAALAEFTTSRELDPLSVLITVASVWPLPHLGREQEAVAEIKRSLDIFRDAPELVDYFHQVQGDAYLHQGRYADAVAELTIGWKTKALCGDDPQTAAALARAYAVSGLAGYWRQQLACAVPHHQQEVEASRKNASRRYVSPKWLAELYARLGDGEQAFALLREAFDNRDENLRFLKAESLLADSPWQHLRPDPRFAQLLRGMGLDP